MSESDKKNVQVIVSCLNLGGADYALQGYVKNAVQAVRGAWKQQPTADSIMEAYGLLLMETEYILAVHPNLAAAVKSVHHKMVDNLVVVSPDPFATGLMEADPIYCEYEDRKAAAEEEEEEEEEKTADENIPEEA